MSRTSLPIFLSLIFFFLQGCIKNNEDKHSPEANLPLPVILDTDANNELDDQHAIAYMLFNEQTFDVRGITINETYSGQELQKHVDEARRIVQLCDREEEVKIIPGASGDYHEIVGSLNQQDFDGHQAVNFIIEEARKMKDEKLILIPVGKLTNITLALQKAPDIASKVKVIWLGSNWPDPGEYNLDNDPTAVAPLLENPLLELEILTVRWGKPSGTAAVSVSVDKMRKVMAGLGPHVNPVEGRHGGMFTCFGDYSIELFEKYGDVTRPLFDVCTLAILKNPDWGNKVIARGVSFDGKNWKNEGNPTRTVTFWENFHKDQILEDFFQTMKQTKKSKDRK